MGAKSSFFAWTLSAVLLSQAGAATAQHLTADEVIRRSIAAQGGQESWDRLRTMEVSGIFTTYSVDHPFRLYRQRPNSYRFEFKLGEWDLIFGYDGTTAWWINSSFLVEVNWAVETPLFNRQVIAGDAEFGGPLLDYQERGHHVELVGRVDLDGADTYQLVVTLSNGSVETWYLGRKDFLPLARISPGSDLVEPLEQRSYFSDYREVAGVLLPHYIEIELGGLYQVMEINEIQANVELTEALFTLSPPPGMAALQSLAGEWEVQVSSRPFPGMPWMESRTKSSIRASAHGGLLEEELSFIANGSPRQVKRLRSWDRFRDVYRTAYFDNLTSHLNVLEGRLEESRLVVTNLDTGTLWQAKGRTVHNREVTYNLDADSFKVDWDVSIDGGSTWYTSVRFAYTRRSEATP